MTGKGLECVYIMKNDMIIHVECVVLISRRNPWKYWFFEWYLDRLFSPKCFFRTREHVDTSKQASQGGRVWKIGVAHV